MLARCSALLAVFGIALALSTAPASAAAVPLTLDATVGPEGATITVGAPGCAPTPPGEFEIFVQAVSPTGEVGEGAVGAGTFTVPGQGSVLIPAGTPVSSFLLTVSCNGGALTGSQPFQLAAPVAAPTAVLVPARFTG
ncbi:MAG TPA: hypothetical protein VGN51_13670 [Acidimicrobiia bacterium]|jgi:hypothetical protein